MKIKILSILFFVFFVNSKAQWGVPPPRREPNKEQIEAVEKFIKITDYKKSIESFLYYSIYKHQSD
ncbi:hypothetical protein BA768_04850 [Chryseobacterium sp. CBo1]|uniref:hypothetical protein n=1 Tax=Chryseobacterium sp. CBo1 TaxID=1869230 RepID=UPI000810D322|nr:hypothetical protein [Chryseobacterium sp. CBo1]OCK50484.1 hypothetical protein BA768_04850 [Chryseobacterium sp. CBo1]